MLNHVFEHMDEPADVLSQLRRRLGGAGAILVRIPMVDSWAWRRYRTDWVQLDAPRHVFLHTRTSFRLLASQVGLAIERVFYDSYSLQFWGSEQYRLDIPLRAAESYAESPESSMFSTAEIQEFTRRARRLNKLQAGDSAGFILRPK